jgi:hypothetical protein
MARKTKWDMKATAEPTPVGSDSGKAREGIKRYFHHHKLFMLSTNAGIVQVVIYDSGIAKRETSRYLGAGSLSMNDRNRQTLGNMALKIYSGG